jgi:hypothetical protein
MKCAIKNEGRLLPNGTSNNTQLTQYNNNMKHESVQTKYLPVLCSMKKEMKLYTGLLVTCLALKRLSDIYINMPAKF